MGIILVGGLVWAAGCGGSTHYPAVVADPAHSIEPGSHKDTAAYGIHSAPGIQLDIGQFQFVSGGTAVRPDTIQVWDVAPTRCRLSQPITGNVISLDATTLTNVAAGGPPFQGFRPGHRIMINVGRTQFNAYDPHYMTYDWTGLVIVK